MESSLSASGLRLARSVPVKTINPVSIGMRMGSKVIGSKSGPSSMLPEVLTVTSSSLPGGQVHFHQIVLPTKSARNSS